MRAFIIAAVLALSVPFAAVAKTYPIPDEDPVAIITLPDNWDADDLDEGIEVTSPDESVYAAIEAVDMLQTKTATVEAFKFFEKKGIAIDKSSQTQRDFMVNGLAAFELGFKGKDEDGSTNVSVTVVAINDKKVLMVTCWASDEGEKNKSGAWSGIINSIQAAQK
jgi:hypothetical protein